MQKLSFIKGLIVGTLFSAIFWLCAYHTVNRLTKDHIPQEQNIEIPEVTEVRASF